MNSRFSSKFILTQHNLKMWKETGHEKVLKYSSLIFHKVNKLKTFKEFQELIKNKKYLKLFLNPKSEKLDTNAMLKVWARHCECVFAQRIRRYQQMFSLYSSWWEERAFREFIKQMRQSLAKRSKEFALGAIGVSSYNWEQNRIPEEELKKHVNDFEYIDILKENTICLSCDPTKRSNINTNICKCGTTGILTNKSYEEWTPFIEKQDLVVWRRLHPTGQSEYKVFGTYNDITAEDFLNVQIDVDYRRKWDNTAVMLEVAEQDPNRSNNSDILYWEMQWPRLFVNRDYVFIRRYLIDKETKTMYVMSKTTEHPKFPKYPDKFRIEEYWSVMVIRPYTETNKLGVEFSLTYFDNPGVNLPASVTNWVAMRAMPDFLEKLRQATVEYRQYCINEGISDDCLRIAAEERAAEEKMQREKLDYCNFERTEQSAIDLKENILNIVGSKKFQFELSEESKKVETVTSSDSAGTSSASKSVWKYFHPLYYFH